MGTLLGVMTLAPSYADEQLTPTAADATVNESLARSQTSAMSRWNCDPR